MPRDGVITIFPVVEEGTAVAEGVRKVVPFQLNEVVTGVVSGGNSVSGKTWAVAKRVFCINNNAK